jgi:hypothetical protein
MVHDETMRPRQERVHGVYICIESRECHRVDAAANRKAYSILLGQRLSSYAIPHTKRHLVHSTRVPLEHPLECMFEFFLGNWQAPLRALPPRRHTMLQVLSRGTIPQSEDIASPHIGSEQCPSTPKKERSKDRIVKRTAERGNARESQDGCSGFHAQPIPRSSHRTAPSNFLEPCMGSVHLSTASSSHLILSQHKRKYPNSCDTPPSSSVFQSAKMVSSNLLSSSFIPPLPRSPPSTSATPRKHLLLLRRTNTHFTVRNQVHPQHRPAPRPRPRAARQARSQDRNRHFPARDRRQGP